MLPKCFRLTRSRDFSRVRRKGRSAGGPLLVLYVASARSPHIRVGFSVSKKVGKAVVRSRVKRLLREAMRPELPRMSSGMDLVFIARPPLADATYTQVREHVCYLLRKTGAFAHRQREAGNA